MMFQWKKISWKLKYESQMFNYGLPPPSPPSKKKPSGYWKFIEVTHLQRSSRVCGSGVIIILLKLFFFKIPDLVHRRTPAPVAAKNRWSYRLPSNNLTAHYNSQFCVSECVWIGPKHDFLHFKSSWGCLLIDSWSCVHPLYVGKRL